MIFEEYEAYKAANYYAQPHMISVPEVSEGGDRTLVYGYTIDRDTFHCYLLDGQIHRLIYDQNYAKPPTYYALDHVYGEYLEALLLSPSKRAYPDATDALMAQLLAKTDSPLVFTTYQFEKERGLFAGATHLTPGMTWDRCNERS